MFLNQNGLLFRQAVCIGENGLKWLTPNEAIISQKSKVINVAQ